jgi:hypothetical protein
MLGARCSVAMKSSMLACAGEWRGIVDLGAERAELQRGDEEGQDLCTSLALIKERSWH